MSLTPEERQEIITVAREAVLAAVQETTHWLQDRDEIINAASEKALLMLPEVVGSLMTQHASLLSINKEFYAKHPDFVKHKPVVQAVVEQLEGKRPLADYQDILRDAIPLIQERIAMQAGLDMTTVKRPDRHLPSLTVSVERDPNGPHGAL